MLSPRELKGRTAISYARWSSERQGAGDSLRRQTEEATRFCTTYGLKLDRQLVDDGVSAYKGANLEASLGRFVEGVKSGSIPSDTVLLVEALDRVSRVNHMDALEYFGSLLRTGITVVTLMDGRVHTLQDYRNNVASVLMSLMAMSAAHEYSAKISERVGASWNARASRASQGRIKISKVPFWIDRESQGFNERVEVAKLIFELAEEGLGQAAIVQHLNQRAIPSASGKTWEKTGVQSTLASKAAYGSYVIKGEEVRDYFPAVVSEARWLALRNRTRERTKNPQASNTANLFARLLRCQHCGSPINLSTARHKDTKFQYLSCVGKALKRTDCNAPNWRYDRFESKVVASVGFLAIPVPDDEADSQLGKRLAEIQDAITVLSNRRDNFISAVAEAETGDMRKVFTTKADEVSREIELRQSELTRLRESEARQQIATGTVVDFEKDAHEIERLALEDRPTAKRLISDLIERIDLETDSPELRRANITFRAGHSHSIVWDSSGAP